MDPIFMIGSYVAVAAVAFAGGIAWTRRQLKESPEKFAAMVEHSKELRDRARKAFEGL